MPLIFDKTRNLHRLHSFQNDAEFEKQVVALADQIFGPSTIYVDVKTLEDVLTFWRRS